MEERYPMIFKRKSFHFFKDIGHISEEELARIEKIFLACRPLIAEIKVGIKTVPVDQTTCNRGQEYCILLYSEKKDRHWHLSDVSGSLHGACDSGDEEKTLVAAYCLA